jgi:Sec7-like guanine-nucleotide exchange factor
MGYARILYKSKPLREAVGGAIEKGFIKNDAPSIALFLLRGTFFGLDRTELGQYLAEHNVGRNICEEFVRLLNFKGLHLFWALK